MNCRRAAKMMPLYAGGELSEKNARRLERHLEACPDCRDRADDFQAVLVEIRTAARGDEIDWTEAEWKSLLARVADQRLRRRTFPLGMSPRPAWAYGAAILLFVALSAIIVRPRFFPSAPIQPAETLAATELRPGRNWEFVDGQFPRLRQDFPFHTRKKKPLAVEQQTLIADAAGVKEAQDVLSMTLVSQESGLKVHWTFNRHFEWKEEAKR